MLTLNAHKGPTGRLIRQMLEERGLLKGKIRAVVNYGYGDNPDGLPILNENAGRLNKYQELVRLDDNGVTTIPFSQSAADLEPPIFGRKLHHTQGKDIFVYQVRPLLRGDRLSDYYTEKINKKAEFRVWVFREKFLACYEKKLTYPERNGRRGRNKDIWNWGNGYAYEFRRPEDTTNPLKQIGIDAVQALDLDFGAVDVVQDHAGFYYVLEVNTAPGTQGAARQGVTNLVNQIERWAKAGFPEV